ncbi:MAG TPA: hypothetical protein VFD30_12175 [Terriglobia bacterium]|jgi:hypothetical protein|nr:hypothetical protein [Terriglobia bacterium]
MTCMIRKAYQMADAVRAVGVPVVMGGPHVTEVPGEPLGRNGGLATLTRWPWAKLIRRGTENGRSFSSKLEFPSSN